MKIYGERVYLEKLKLNHIDQMQKWGRHNNTLLEDYNYSLENLSMRKMFLFERTASPFKKYYAVCLHDGKMIGFIGVRNINYIKKTSLLGIVFDPNHLNKGYGTEGLQLFLRMYFNEMKMKIMYLEVARFNKRAIRAYEKIGFKYMAEYLDLYRNQMNYEDINYLENKNSFIETDGMVYNYIHVMRITENDFKEMEIENEI